MCHIQSHANQLHTSAQLSRSNQIHTYTMYIYISTSITHLYRVVDKRSRCCHYNHSKASNYTFKQSFSWYLSYVCADHNDKINNNNNNTNRWKKNNITNRIKVDATIAKYRLKIKLQVCVCVFWNVLNCVKIHEKQQCICDRKG